VKRNITILLLVLFLVVLVSGCKNATMIEAIEEELISMVISLEKFDYARAFRFEFQMMFEGEQIISGSHLAGHVINPMSEYFDPSINDLIFVHSEADAVGFPSNILVAWPRANDPHGFYTRLIDGLHWAVNRDSVCLLADFTVPERDIVALKECGLSYPLSIADLVDNWEKVSALWNALSRSERSMLARS